MRYILRLSCPDRMGIVAAVSAFLVEHHCNIVESAQFGDREVQRFFMRVSFESLRASTVTQLQSAFASIGGQFAMQWAIYDTAVKPRVILMVSKFGHCLNDLLYRYRVGALSIEIPAIVANHPDFQPLAEANGIPFHLLPVTRETRSQQEQRLLSIIERERCDLVVLARYMQSSTLME